MNRGVSAEVTRLPSCASQQVRRAGVSRRPVAERVVKRWRVRERSA